MASTGCDETAGASKALCRQAQHLVIKDWGSVAVYYNSDTVTSQYIAHATCARHHAGSKQPPPDT